MADVTVLGAGIFGLSVAWCCIRRGASVRVIDPAGPGAGSSGGLVGALAPHIPENWNAKKAFQFESLIAAERFWGEVDAASGKSSGYARLGRLQPIADDAALERARARAASARELWQGKAEWRVERADTGAAWAPVSPTGWLVRDTLSARMHPRMACRSLAEAIRREGGDIAAEGTASGRVVWATGWHGLAELSERLGKQVGNGVKGQAASLGHDARDMPQIFAEGVHVVPHADGTVAVGSTSERDFERPDDTDAQLDAVIAAARRVCPALEGAAVLERWASVRPRARSRAPMLGRYPGREGHFIANGGFKIGFGMAPMAGEVMAALVLEGRDDIPEGFEPEAST